MHNNQHDIDIMGIVNLTDNSYFAESRCLDVSGQPDFNKVLFRTEVMIKDGASIIDIGACSTRPGSSPVGEQIEWERLRKILPTIRKEFPEIKISVDTYFPKIVEKVYSEIGSFIVNDVTGGNGMQDDNGSIQTTGESEMLDTVGRLGLQYISMHMRGNAKTMQNLTQYEDTNTGLSNVTAAVVHFFEDFSKKAKKAGIKDWILDPGFGFSKTIEQNYSILKELKTFKCFDKRILIGVSRKSMIFRLFDITPEEALPATQALHFSALCNGADILRVHDVKEAAQTIKIYNLLKNE